MANDDNSSIITLNSEGVISMFECKIEGCPVTIDDTNHSIRRYADRGITDYAVYGSIIAVGSAILDYPNGTEFVIIDEDINVSVVCGLHASGGDITIDIVTVIDNANIWVKKGTRIINYRRLLGSMQE